MSTERISAVAHLVAALFTVAALFFAPTIVLWCAVWTFSWTALFGFVLWAGPSWAAGQPRSEPPRFEHEGLASLALAFFVLVESVPVTWAFAVYLPRVDPLFLAGLTVNSFALFRTSWLYAEVILVYRIRRRVESHEQESLIKHLQSIKSPPGTPMLALASCGMLLQRQRWNDCLGVLEAFPPIDAQGPDVHERWGMMKFRCHMKLGALDQAKATLTHKPAFSDALIRSATLWLDAVNGRGRAVLNVLDGKKRPDDLGPGFEDVVRAHALVSLGREEDARLVLERLEALDDVLEPAGPASELARSMGAPPPGKP